MKEVSADTFNGLQFDVENLGLQPVIVNSFSARFASMGYHHMEVWMREGSHMGSSAGCDNWNNWCNDWTKLADTSVQTAVSLCVLHPIFNLSLLLILIVPTNTALPE